MRCKKGGPLSPIPGLRGIWAPARQAGGGRSTQATSDAAARPQRRFPAGFRRTGPDFMLRALRMRYGHSTRRAPRLRASASETRLMRIIETGSGQAPRSIRIEIQDNFADVLAAFHECMRFRGVFERKDFMNHGFYVAGLE